MIINKNAALAFLVCNVILVGLHLFLLLYLSEPIFGINALKPGTYISFWLISAVIEMISRFAISVGIFWVLKIFNEKTWIRVAFLSFLAWQILDIISFGIANQQLLPFASIIYSITITLLIILLMAFSRLKSKVVKPWLIGFAALTLLEIILTRLGPFLYDNLNIEWLLINQRFLTQFPPLATLVLFIVVFSISRRKSDVNEVTPAT